jgi:hypothetical protein
MCLLERELICLGLAHPPHISVFGRANHPQFESLLLFPEGEDDLNATRRELQA